MTVKDWTTRAFNYVADTPSAFIALNLAIFVAFLYFVRLDTVITILNGVFFGTTFGLVVAYGGMFYQAFFNRARYGVQMQPKVKRFALSILASWVAYGIVVYSSVKLRSTDVPVNTMVDTAVSRWLIILAAVGQVLAADTGENILYGRDRKALWAGFFVGLLFAAFAVYVQENKTFAGGFLWRLI